MEVIYYISKLSTIIVVTLYLKIKGVNEVNCLKNTCTVNGFTNILALNIIFLFVLLSELKIVITFQDSYNYN